MYKTIEIFIELFIPIVGCVIGVVWGFFPKVIKIQMTPKNIKLIWGVRIVSIFLIIFTIYRFIGLLNNWQNISRINNTGKF